MIADHTRSQACEYEATAKASLHQKVSELPVQFPTKFQLLVNLKTAKAIGLTIPEAFLLRADELIE